MARGRVARRRSGARASSGWRVPWVARRRGGDASGDEASGWRREHDNGGQGVVVNAQCGARIDRALWPVT